MIGPHHQYGALNNYKDKYMNHYWHRFTLFWIDSWHKKQVSQRYVLQVRQARLYLHLLTPDIESYLRPSIDELVLIEDKTLF
jgi:hypothetical protein